MASIRAPDEKPSQKGGPGRFGNKEQDRAEWRASYGKDAELGKGAECQPLGE